MRANDVANMITPEQVAFIFAKKAGGLWQKQIPPSVERAWPDSGRYITEHAVRMILHRREPFDSPALYEKVSPEHAEKVLGSFKSRGPNKQRAKQKPDTATSPILDNVDQTATVLAGVLKAKMCFDRKLAEAEAMGFSPEAVKAWIAMATTGDLQ